MRGWVRRLGTEAICAAIVAAAGSAPYAHVHTDAGHNSDHHHGRQAHSHPPIDHQHEQDSDSTDTVTPAQPRGLPQPAFAVHKTRGGCDAAGPPAVVLDHGAPLPAPCASPCAKAPPPRPDVTNGIINRGPPR